MSVASTVNWNQWDRFRETYYTYLQTAKGLEAARENLAQADDLYRKAQVEWEGMLTTLRVAGFQIKHAVEPFSDVETPASPQTARPIRLNDEPIPAPPLNDKAVR